jgi:hypothetical protein
MRFNPFRVVIPFSVYPGWLVPRNPGLSASNPVGIGEAKQDAAVWGPCHPNQNNAMTERLVVRTKARAMMERSRRQLAWRA